MTTVLYILAGIVGLILILSILVPKTYDIFRTIEIDSPRTKVFPHLLYLEKQQAWSPWAKKDPNMQRKLIGTDGEVGAVSYWNGNKDVGEGEQEITKIIDGERVEGKLRFFKPWKSESDCYMSLKESADGKSLVTWGFSAKNKFPMSVMMLFMSMDKMVGKDFEKGLKTLKTKLENQ